jgi:tetratricopeptide (TPR) repeat protein
MLPACYIGQSPASPDNYFRQGNELMAAGEWENAEGVFRTAIRIDPNNALYHIALIFALSNEHHKTDIIPEVRACARLQATSWLLSINEVQSPARIAYVHTERFGDESKGILKYVRAKKEGDKAIKSVAGSIGKALDQFAKEHSIGLIVDEDELLKLSAKIEMGSASDVTAEFIDYFNRLNPQQ